MIAFVLLAVQHFSTEDLDVEQLESVISLAEELKKSGNSNDFNLQIHEHALYTIINHEIGCFVFVDLLPLLPSSLISHLSLLILTPSFLNEILLEKFVYPRITLEHLVAYFNDKSLVGQIIGLVLNDFDRFTSSRHLSKLFKAILISSGDYFQNGLVESDRLCHLFDMTIEMFKQSKDLDFCFISQMLVLSTKIDRARQLSKTVKKFFEKENENLIFQCTIILNQTRNLTMI
ncbi:hypothetical protein GEMRC1_009303 [Eukaryota sp. GEM-RC1]